MSRCTTSFTTCCESLVHYNLHIYIEVQIDGDTHDEVMSDIGVKQRCPLSPTLFGLYVDKLETYLDEINRESPCLFNTMVAILLYVDDVVLLSKFGPCLQRP